MSKMKTIGIPALVVLSGAAVAAGVSVMGTEPVIVAQDEPELVVQTQVAQVRAHQAMVAATGLISPGREVSVIPEVSGRIVYVSDRLVPGGRFRTGEVMARIDARDYELAVEQQRGLVRSAELEVEMERARQAIALEEWRLLGDGGEPSPLVLRESQRAAAEMNLNANRSALERAQLGLERTELRAPFNATVLSETVDEGQVVGPQSQVARLIGTDNVRILLSVRLEDLELIELSVDGEEGSLVVVRQRVGAYRVVERTGRVAHRVDELDPETRRAQVLVLVENPMSLGDALPLLPGAFVDAEVRGRSIEGAIAVPRAAIYDGNTVWVLSPQSTLERRSISRVWSDDTYVYVKEGLEDGALLVLSPLVNPVEGASARSLAATGSQP